jgi:hypothetical protein
MRAPWGLGARATAHPVAATSRRRRPGGVPATGLQPHLCRRRDGRIPALRSWPSRRMRGRRPADLHRHPGVPARHGRRRQRDGRLPALRSWPSRRMRGRRLADLHRRQGCHGHDVEGCRALQRVSRFDRDGRESRRPTTGPCWAQAADRLFHVEHRQPLLSKSANPGPLPPSSDGVRRWLRRRPGR